MTEGTEQGGTPAPDACGGDGREWRRQRRRVGISRSFAATHLDVDVDTIRQWETGEIPLPQEAQEMLEGIEGVVRAMDEKLIADIRGAVEKSRGKQPQGVKELDGTQFVFARFLRTKDLRHFYPRMPRVSPNIFNAHIIRVRDRLITLGARVDIVEYDRRAYDAFRKHRRVKDNTDSLVSWMRERAGMVENPGSAAAKK
jgi:DNA-binding transcriptional regulator YiaG